MDGKPIDQVWVGNRVRSMSLDWLYREETGSTNADALHYRSSRGRDVVVFGEAQTAGRGRRGRQWVSPATRNICCTVGLTRPIGAERQGLLSIVTGVALCRALRESTGLEVALKWPNDLLLDGLKFGGILIESRALDAGRFFFAIGFGLNLAMSDAELAALERPATSLDRHLDEAPERAALLVEAVEAVVRAMRGFRVEAAAQLVDEFARLDAYHGETVEVLSGEDRISGANRGIDEYGRLRLETAQGIELHSAAEISLRPGP